MLTFKPCIARPELRPGILEYVNVNISQLCFRNLMYISFFSRDILSTMKVSRGSSFESSLTFIAHRVSCPPFSNLLGALLGKTDSFSLSPISLSSSFWGSGGALYFWTEIIVTWYHYPNPFRCLCISSPVYRALLYSNLYISSKGGISHDCLSLQGSRSVPRNINLILS